MKKRLLMIAACTVALSTQAQAVSSNKLNTLIGSGIAAIGAAGMIYSGVQWGTTANELENGALLTLNEKHCSKQKATTNQPLPLLQF